MVLAEATTFSCLHCMHAALQTTSPCCCTDTLIRSASTPPAPEGVRTVTEGAATVLLGSDVFYNPAQVRA